MSDHTHIFIEYKVLEGKQAHYEKIMRDITCAQSEYDVHNHRWFAAADQPNLYVEWMSVNDYEQYERLKAARRNADDPIFGLLAACIHKPLSEINCWAFYEKNFKGNEGLSS